jgi:hypothetical protein
VSWPSFAFSTTGFMTEIVMDLERAADLNGPRQPAAGESGRDCRS